MTNKLYAERDAEELGQHYCNHVSAMTSESLHSKSDIACELAYRDQQIEKLRESLSWISFWLLENSKLDEFKELLEWGKKSDELLEETK